MVPHIEILNASYHTEVFVFLYYIVYTVLNLRTIFERRKELTRLIYFGVETIYFVVFVVKSALKVIPSIIIFTR